MTPEAECFLGAYSETREWVAAADEAGLSLQEADALFNTDESFRSAVNALRDRWRLVLRDKAMSKAFGKRATSTDLQRGAQLLGDNWNKLEVSVKHEHSITINQIQEGEAWVAKKLLKDVTPAS